MQLALTDGAYEARSVIASAQRCVNLYPETNQLNKTLAFPSQMTNAIITHYLTDGLTLLATLGSGPIRGIYTASNGSIFIVSGAGLYVASSVATLSSATLLGSIAYNTTPVSMIDNTTDLVLVDGTTSGYKVVLATNAFAQISDSAFYGADFVDYIDTFLYFNKPGTPQWYSTTSGVVTPFDALYFANKTGYVDNLVRAISMHREIWLIGEKTTEVWYDAGNSSFPFAEVPGAFIQHGTCAKYSISAMEQAVFWLSQNVQGEAVVLKGANYTAERISTHAIEQAISNYSVITDAIGFIYQREGHNFYVLTFPTADKTWVYDTVTMLWHERMYLGADGKEHRILPMSSCFAAGYNLCGDHSNGNVYYFDRNNQTDNGMPIERIRSFPTLQNELKRTSYQRFSADMQVGSDTKSQAANLLQVGLRYSDTGGQNWSDITYQTLGLTGQYHTNVQWRRLGLGRRRVFELRWSSPVPTALNGAYIDLASSEA